MNKQTFLKTSKEVCIICLCFCMNIFTGYGQNVFPLPAGDVGIGTLTPNSDLQIINKTGVTGCTIYGLYPINPALRMDDNHYNPSGISVPLTHNVFELWHNEFDCSGLPLEANLIFNITASYNSGAVAINKPIPTSTLDVGGSINADNNIMSGHDISCGNNLFVNGGQIDMTMPGDATWRNINANSGENGLTISAGNGGAYQQYQAVGNSDPGAMQIAVGNQGSGATFWSFGLDGSGSGCCWQALMRLKPNGQVAIGGDIIYPFENLPNPEQYHLYVSKGILTEKVKVALVGPPGSNWSDFVFNKDYNLMPLTNVEAYVKANKHLPGIPSANEVKEDGIDVATMDAKLLQKIEELTLYVIQQQKEIEELKKK